MTTHAPKAMTRAVVAAGVGSLASAIAYVLAACTLSSAFFIAHAWPLDGDAPLMHYVVFLMSKGFAPYKDIVEMNLPGSYLSEILSLGIFGGSAQGWVHYDFALDLLAVAGAAWIAGPKCRAAGVLAGTYACVAHLRDGAWDLGQRDWLVTVLLLFCAGSVAQARRSGRSLWLLPGFFAAGFAVTIKPPAILFCLSWLSIYLWTERKAGRVFAGAVACASVGFLAPLFIALAWLGSWHVISSFLLVSKTLIPYYASRQHQSLQYMFWSQFDFKERLVELAALGALALYARQRSWRSFQSNVLAAGALCGTCSYVVQHKGFLYHLYPAVTFYALLLVVEVVESFQQRGARDWLAGAIAALGLATMFLNLREESKSMHTQSPDIVVQLTSDLQRLGKAGTNGEVQCLDMTWAGCINTLFQTHTVQSTGFIYDFYLFPRDPNSITERLQSQFLHEVEAKPPSLIVLGDQNWPGDTHDFGQVARWPSFAGFLGAHYHLIKTYTTDSGRGGYQLYALEQ